MPTHREQFSLNAPTEVIEEALPDYFKHLWNILSQESGRMLAEEKIFGQEPYSLITFIGATQLEVVIKTVSAGTVVICEATNEYYGDDLPKGKDLAEIFLQAKVMQLREKLEETAKSWSAKQRYQAVKEQQRLPQLEQDKLLATRNTISPSTTKSGDLKPEQLSIEDFVAHLERLANLQRSGALTDDEYQQAKASLLKATE